MINLSGVIYNPVKLNRLSQGFSFLAPAGMAVFSPILLNREYKRKGRPDRERRMLVFQEAVSQGINLLVHWASFLGLRALARKAFLKAFPELAREQHAAALVAALTIAANVGSFLGMSFLRPVISAKILNRWANRKAAEMQIEPPVPMQRNFQAQGMMQSHGVNPFAARQFSALAPPPAFRKMAASRYSAPLGSQLG